MTEYQLARRAINLFSNYEVPHETRRRYQRQWMRSVRTLGSQWLYAHQSPRLSTQLNRSEADTNRISISAANAVFGR